MSALVLSIVSGPAFGQAADSDLAPGKVIFATEKLGDPNFAKTVILLVERDDEQGTLGLIVNHRSDIPLARVFPQAKHATKDPVYLGGPVEPTTAQALLLAPDDKTGAVRVAGDIYASGAKALIDKSIESQADSTRFRLYLGYAGWAPGQLEAEFRVGAWMMIRGTAKLVFDPEPDTLWTRLNRESKMNLALAGKAIRPQVSDGSRVEFALPWSHATN